MTISKTYYENGQLKLVQVFNLDTVSMKKSGIQISYYLNGKIQDEITYVEDTFNIKRYDESGAILRNEKNVLINPDTKI
ncbi:hypothetical protein KIV10_13505 [Aequorivita echinoideorum]|uniref:YD repeat-containing protein n=2 Tax=Aequorivita echinoideorum TaxID=1549647 RepID=A0ABS5S894_9FLAO|nr:hypothetical protein [Aequorivita echinoideorum]